MSVLTRAHYRHVRRDEVSLNITISFYFGEKNKYILPIIVHHTRVLYRKSLKHPFLTRGCIFFYNIYSLTYPKPYSIVDTLLLSLRVSVCRRQVAWPKREITRRCDGSTYINTYGQILVCRIVKHYFTDR